MLILNMAKVYKRMRSVYHCRPRHVGGCASNSMNAKWNAAFSTPVLLI